MQRYQLLPSDPNEAISDSVIRALEAYDVAVSSGTSCFASLFQHKDHPDIASLREALARTPGWFLEGDEKLADELENWLLSCKPLTHDEPAAMVFKFLENRLDYLHVRQKRSPLDLTADYKILLVGDGWVKRAHPKNPVIQAIMRPGKGPEAERWADAVRSSLNLETRDFVRSQVYTVDINRAQCADLFSNILEIQPGELPAQYFDFVYLEGFGFIGDDDLDSFMEDELAGIKDINEEAVAQALQHLSQDAWRRALEKAFFTLKEDGLILYHHPKNPRLYLQAKSSNITQEKLDKIPACLKTNIQKDWDLAPFENVETPNTNKIKIIRADEARILQKATLI